MATLVAAAANEGTVWWVWGPTGFAVWLAVAFLLAFVIERGLRIADRQSPDTGGALTTDGLPASLRPAPSPVGRGAIPVPTTGVALLAVAVALETADNVGRLTGATGAGTRVLSMDAPLSLLRMYVAALFAAAALASASSLLGRRIWWLAVGLVAPASLR